MKAGKICNYTELEVALAFIDLPIYMYYTALSFVCISSIASVTTTDTSMIMRQGDDAR